MADGCRASLPTVRMSVPAKHRSVSIIATRTSFREFEQSEHDRSINQKRYVMPKFLIKREIPGAGRMNAEELQAASQQSCGALRQIGSDV